MDPTLVQEAFREFATLRGVDLAASMPATGLDTLVAFYRDLRADGVDLADSGDMLLCEWGCWSWNGGDFSVDFTRQVILPDEDDDDAIWQLHLTYRFEAEESLSRFGEGGVDWLSSPDGVDAWSNQVRSSPAFAMVAQRTPKAVEVDWECAG